MFYVICRYCVLLLVSLFFWLGKLRIECSCYRAELRIQFEQNATQPPREMYSAAQRLELARAYLS